MIVGRGRERGGKGRGRKREGSLDLRGNTEEPELQDVQGPKRVATPLQHIPMSRNGPYFGESPLAGFNKGAPRRFLDADVGKRSN